MNVYHKVSLLAVGSQHNKNAFKLRVHSMRKLKVKWCIFNIQIVLGISFSTPPLLLYFSLVNLFFTKSYFYMCSCPILYWVLNTSYMKLSIFFCKSFLLPLFMLREFLKNNIHNIRVKIHIKNEFFYKISTHLKMLRLSPFQVFFFLKFDKGACRSVFWCRTSLQTFILFII